LHVEINRVERGECAALALKNFADVADLVSRILLDE
jgi:hypothetical protein